jgi:glycosyltransferase involved in cell wall biosynthesis
MKYSLVIPVYRNEGSIPELLSVLAQLNMQLGGELEVVFVVDGSPDRCHLLLRDALPNAPFTSQLLLHSRNFGSFAAIRSGLAAARGGYFAVMAADLQEPPEIAIDFFRRLETGAIDVVVGTRDARSDPGLSRLASNAFWWIYRTLINPDIPAGGVDIFGCNVLFRDHLLALDEQHSSLIGLLFWLGFRRETVGYERRVRRHGKSAWTFRRKLTYMFDSMFAFSDLPIRFLLLFGLGGVTIAFLFGCVVVFSRLTGAIDVPGYSPTILAILFFGGMNALGLGIIGAYAWRAFANTQRRPLAVVMMKTSYDGAKETSA